MSEQKVELSALRFSVSSLIATAPLICLMVIGWFNMDKRQTLNEHVTSEHGKIIKQLSEGQITQQRTSDRLSIIVDEMLRQSTWGGSGKLKSTP